MQKKLISIIGPTGIGKTNLAIKAASFFSTEIVSCDSRQFFKEMKIGTAIPSEVELRQAKHHFIGNLSVENYYSIGQYEVDALSVLENIFENNDYAILVGGSSMYEKALTEGLNELPEADPDNQNKIFEIFETEGIEKVQSILEKLDPEYYEKADIENPRRLFRAIDVILQTGKKYSELIALPKCKRNFEVIRIGIEAPREIIYQRINERVNLMLENGLLEEAKSLINYRNNTALQTVGYAELFQYFDGEFDLETAVEEIKKNTRRFAKRQMTWNRKFDDVNWLKYNYSEEDLISLLNRLKS